MSTLKGPSSDSDAGAVTQQDGGDHAITELPPRLQMAGVSKSYGGTVALDGVTLTVAAGEVHALLGENGAGKSTLIKVLTGAIEPDGGEVSIGGFPVHLAGRRNATKAGISAVFQELSLVPDLTVAQNLWLDRMRANALGLVSVRRLASRTDQLLTEFDSPAIDAHAVVADLPLAQRQVVEILRALSYRPQVLVLDEATSALAPSEVDWVLRQARAVADRGGSVIFTSHRMDEVRRVTDRITILRNGRNVLSVKTREASDDEIVSAMLGSRPTQLYPERSQNPRYGEETALEVWGLDDGKRLRGVSFAVAEGEILGVGGLQGQGQIDLLLALYGVNPAAGTLRTPLGTRSLPSNPAQAIERGIALVPEDRQRQGLMLDKSIRANLSLPVISRLSRLGLVSRRREAEAAGAAISRLGIKTPDSLLSAGSLSGGNQQKVLLAKTLELDTTILLMADPVRGVDVGTKAEIFTLMRELVSNGYSIVFYSSDLQELVRVSDRVIVLHDGDIVDELTDDRLTEHEALRASISAGTASGSQIPRDSSKLVRVGSLRTRMSTLAPYAMVLVLLGVLLWREPRTFELDQINFMTATMLPLVLVAAAQTFAVLVGGVDLSVGGLVSLTTVVVATQFSSGPLLWGEVVLLVGLASILGSLNGVIVLRLRMDPFIVTLATWSIWGGVALLVLDTTGGSVPEELLDFGNGQVLGIGTAVLLVALILLAWRYFTRTKTGIRVTAVGSSQHAVRLAGVPVAPYLIVAYAISGALSAMAGIFLTTQTMSGSPVIGNYFILTSVAAVVIGGSKLSGGQASMGGSVMACIALTLIASVVFSFGLASGWQVAASGGLLILVVLLRGLPEVLRQVRGLSRLSTDPGREL